MRQLDLKPLNDMPDLPLYGTEPRVKVRSLRGPWQEIELRVHGYSEIDRPEFWDFIDRAVAGFGKYSQQAQEKTDILQPWKQLGRKWHFARRGFPLGGKVEWEMEVLEDLVELLNETAPYGQFFGTTSRSCRFTCPQQREPWAAVQTKKLDAVYLHLTGPKGRFAQGQITGLGFDAQVDGEKTGLDVLRIKFRSTEDLRRGNLAAFLKEHLAALRRRMKRRSNACPNPFSPNASSFRFSAPCLYRDPLWKASGAGLDEKHRLVNLAELDDRPAMAEVSAAWSEAGLVFAVSVERQEAAGLVPRLASGGQRRPASLDRHPRRA